MAAKALEQLSPLQPNPCQCLRHAVEVDAMIEEVSGFLGIVLQSRPRLSCPFNALAYTVGWE